MDRAIFNRQAPSRAMFIVTLFFQTYLIDLLIVGDSYREVGKPGGP